MNNIEYICIDETFIGGEDGFVDGSGSGDGYGDSTGVGDGDDCDVVYGNGAGRGDGSCMIHRKLNMDLKIWM